MSNTSLNRPPTPRIPWWVHVGAAGAIIGAALYYSIPAAGADPDVNYAVVSAPAVCGVLDDYPTFSGIEGVLAGVMRDSGFTAYQAGQVVYLAVEETCPRHLPLLDRFAATYAPTTTRIGGVV